ncbi:MAG: hypothetical protein N3Z29_04550 [Synechococcaceae cyanobacterium MAG-AL1]|nr:hypothetical protein [Candidatus Regnicoccus frigidus MAG-AL1]
MALGFLPVQVKALGTFPSVLESDLGDFSDNPATPTFLGPLVLGTNTVSGTITVGPNGTSLIDISGGDADFFSFTNPSESSLTFASLQFQVTNFTPPPGAFDVTASVFGTTTASGSLPFESNISFTSLNSFTPNSTGNLVFAANPLVATGGSPLAFGSYSYEFKIETVPAPAPVAAALLFPGLGWLRKRYRA